MELSKHLTVDRIRVPLTATNKTAAITELVDLLSETDALLDRDTVLEAVLKREAERSTGIGYGLAIPHGKSDGCNKLVMAAGQPAEPLDFASIDARPVKFIVLLVSPPDQTGPHIQALARISRLMNIEQFRTKIETVTTAQELHEAIAAAEA